MYVWSTLLVFTCQKKEKLNFKSIKENKQIFSYIKSLISFNFNFINSIVNMMLTLSGSGKHALCYVLTWSDFIMVITSNVENTKICNYKYTFPFFVCGYLRL